MCSRELDAHCNDRTRSFRYMNSSSAPVRFGASGIEKPTSHVAYRLSGDILKSYGARRETTTLRLPVALTMCTLLSAPMCTERRVSAVAKLSGRMGENPMIAYQ